MYRRTLELLVSLSECRPEWRCLVVTQYPEIEAVCKVRGISCLHNSRAEEGISSSIRLALSHSCGDYAAFFVADQPELTLNTVQSLLEGFFVSGKGLGCVSGNGKCGNPCVFSRRYFSELSALQGDRGGKAVIRRHPEDLFLWEVEDPSELEDVDTPRL